MTCLLSSIKSPFCETETSVSLSHYLASADCKLGGFLLSLFSPLLICSHLQVNTTVITQTKVKKMPSFTSFPLNPSIHLKINLPLITYFLHFSFHTSPRFSPLTVTNQCCNVTSRTFPVMYFLQLSHWMPNMAWQSISQQGIPSLTGQHTGQVSGLETAHSVRYTSHHTGDSSEPPAPRLSRQRSAAAK